MLNFNISHIAGDEESSFVRYCKNLFAHIMKKQKTILSEEERNDRIESICFLLPLVVTALAIIIMRILYDIYM